MDIITKIWPQWETVELIGSGSFGKVYKAKRKEFGNEYFSAIKVMRIPSEQAEIKDLQRSGMDARSICSYYEDMIRNLLNEIQIMESLKSANNIVGIEDHQVVKIEEGIGWEIYIRMELLVDLGSYLEQHTMSVDEIVRMGIDVCRALIACEKVNIIHRDIKIDNVFVNEFGSFKLGDFGISKQLEKTQSAVSQKGTNMYMAPEVFRGEHYDQTVDIYSLGIMMYRLANDGRFPFMPPVTQPLQFNDTQRALEKRLMGEPMPDPSSTDAELSRIIRKACEYRSENRYQSAEELAKELQQYFYQKSIRPSVPQATQSVHVAESMRTMKSEDEHTYAAFSSGVEKRPAQQVNNEKQSHIDAPEWSLSGNPTIAAALEVAKGIDSSENDVVKQSHFANDSLVEAKRGQEEELEKTMVAIPESVPSKPIKTESVKTEQTQAKPESEEKEMEKTKPKKSRKGMFIVIGAAVLVLGVLASLNFFVVDRSFGGVVLLISVLASLYFFVTDPLFGAKEEMDISGENDAVTPIPVEETVSDGNVTVAPVPTEDKTGMMVFNELTVVMNFPDEWDVSDRREEDVEYQTVYGSLYNNSSHFCAEEVGKAFIDGNIGESMDANGVSKNLENYIKKYITYETVDVDEEDLEKYVWENPTYETVVINSQKYIKVSGIIEVDSRDYAHVTYVTIVNGVILQFVFDTEAATIDQATQSTFDSIMNTITYTY